VREASVVSLEYASEHMTAAVKSLATSESPLQERLQFAWDNHVQMLWMKPCLPADLLREFRDFWHRYTARSDNRTATTLRDLTSEELKRCIDELVDLSARIDVAAQSRVDQSLAILADLS
jgi:hypothetical protein